MRYVPARVTDIVDGNTIAVAIPDGRVVTVRLVVDAPELDQPHGKEAKEALARLVTDRRVTCLFVGSDYAESTQGPYGSAIAYVDLKDPEEKGAMGEYLALWLLRHGHAWGMTERAAELANFPKNPGGYINGHWGRALLEARKRRLGLWSEPDPIAPWNWSGDKRLVRDATASIPDQIRYLVSERLNDKQFSTLAERACETLEVTRGIVGFYTSRKAVLGDDWTNALSKSPDGVAAVVVRDGKAVEVKSRAKRSKARTLKTRTRNR